MNGIFENLKEQLLPYSDHITISAAWIGIAQIVSPAFALNRIRKNAENSKVPVFPFLFVAMYLALVLRFSQLVNNQALYDANLKGFTLSVIYVFAFYYISAPSKKRETLIFIASGCAVVMILFYYSANGDQQTIVVKFERAMRSVLWSFHFIAMIGIYMGFKHKTSSHLVFEMSLASALMGFNRICHGILTDRRFDVFQHSFFFLVCLGQLSCFLFFGWYESPKAVKSDKKESTEKKKKGTKNKSKKE